MDGSSWLAQGALKSISAAAELKEKAEPLGAEGRAGVLLGAMEAVTVITLTFRKAHLGSDARMRGRVSMSFRQQLPRLRWDHSQHSPVRAASRSWD